MKIFPPSSLLSLCVCATLCGSICWISSYICIFRSEHGCKKQRSRRGLDCFEPSLLKTFSQWQSLMPFLFPPSTDTTLVSLLTPHSYFLRKLKIVPFCFSNLFIMLLIGHLNVLNLFRSETSVFLLCLCLKLIDSKAWEEAELCRLHRELIARVWLLRRYCKK